MAGPRGSRRWNRSRAAAVWPTMKMPIVPTDHPRGNAPPVASPWVVLAWLIAALAFAGCATAGSSGQGSATPRPTPSPIAVDVTTPEAAAALALATDPRFSGIQPLRPDIIGASAWWEASAGPGDDYTVTITIGWGDCQAGCIDRHVWTFTVSPDGHVALASETGPPVPAGVP